MRSITKFDGKNFQLWKFQMNAVLVANSIQNIVDGTKAEPIEPAGDREQRRKDNAKAMFLILTALEDDHLECLLTCTTAAVHNVDEANHHSRINICN